MQTDHESPVTERFERLAIELGVQPTRRERVYVQGQVYFEFGDLRVDTPSSHVIVETESSGGATNLVKLWYWMDEGRIGLPVVLFHIYRKTSEHDYESHRWYWQFIADRMKESMGDRFEARCYTYTSGETLDHDLQEPLSDFRSLLENSSQ